MQIHMLSQSLPPANLTGAPMQALQLACALRDAGNDVHLFSTRAPTLRNEGAFDSTFIPYLPVAGFRALTRFAGTFALGKRIGRADIVHGHALSTAVIAYALARRSNEPPYLVKPSLGGLHSEGELGKLRRALPGRLLRRAFSRINAFAVLDDTIEDELHAFGVSRERIFRVDNGIDRSQHQKGTAFERGKLRDQFRLSQSDVVILFAGQLTERKGVRELLNAWSGLSEKTARARLVLCGDGPLRNAVLAAQQADRSITWLGQMPSIAPVLRCADALILPSRAESFGNVVVEAMSSAVPVAATRVGVAPRIVAPGENGWLIQDVSIEAIKSTLAEVLGDVERLPELGANGPSKIAHLDFSAIAKKYQDIYRSLIKMPPTRT